MVPMYIPLTDTFKATYCCISLNGLSYLLSVQQIVRFHVFFREMNHICAVVVMILRVWALWNQSRCILGILLTFCIIEVIAYLVDCVILDSKQDIGM